MSERIFVRGMVLLSQTAGETDKRVTLFTIEQGKVNAFARGARRVTSSLSAATEPFSFGTLVPIGCHSRGAKFSRTSSTSSGFTR